MTPQQDHLADERRSLQRLRFEEALRECERLAEIGRVSASIVHEIKNPLEALTHILYLLEHAAPSDAQRRYIGMGKAEVARARDIAGQTLDFARSLPQPTQVNVRQILDDVLKFYDRKIKYKKVKVETRHNFDGVVKGSPGELRQIFSNLVVNSLEVLETGRGQLKLHSFPCRNWKYWDQSGVRVVICDNGPGIPPERRKQIFEPFFTTKGDKGSGLGLWIVRSLVRKYGGALRLWSSVRPGQSGTCFSVFLPCG